MCQYSLMLTNRLFDGNSEELAGRWDVRAGIYLQASQAAPRGLADLWLPITVRRMPVAEAMIPAQVGRGEKEVSKCGIPKATVMDSGFTIELSRAPIGQTVAITDAFP